MGKPRTAVLMDYQNIHLTARDLFLPSCSQPADALIDPLNFALQVVAVRAARHRDSWQQTAELCDVLVFRGAPSNKRDPRLYAISQKQRSAWTQDNRVGVTYRTLRYPADWPARRAQEKGIDVLFALHFVKLAVASTYDVVVLASHDTDFEPALEMAIADGTCAVETCGWVGGRIPRCGGRRLWHTALGPDEFKKSRDPRPYWNPPGQP